MQLKPEHNIREIARNRGLAQRDITPHYDRVLVVYSQRAALWLMGHGVHLIRKNQDGSITFSDADGMASTHYDFFISRIAR